MTSRLSNQNEAELTAQSIYHPKVERVLRWFEKEGNELVGEKILKDVRVEHLQDLFGISSDNPMYDCYPLLTAEQSEYFQNLIDLKIDTQLYDYFLECDAVVSQSERSSESLISKPPIPIKYRVCLLINLPQKEGRGGYLILSEQNTDPGFVIGDKFPVEKRVGRVTPERMDNISFNFDVEVIDIKETPTTNQELLIEILVESPDREAIQNLINAYRELNRDKDWLSR